MDWSVSHPSVDELNASLPDNLAVMLRDRADTTPTRKAFVFFDHGVTITYGELDQQVRRVAHGLLAMGARKGTHIAVMLPNVVEFPVTWLAIAWIGAVSVQINPRFTGKELDYAISDADVDFLVIDETCLPALETMQQRTSRLPNANVIVRTEGPVCDGYTSWRALAGHDALPPEPRAELSAHDLMAILYTSGTTGLPKGCMLDHRYWLQIGIGAIFCQGGHRPRNVLLYEPMYYIQGNTICVAALLCNATVYCPAQPSISKFFDWVHRYEIDYCAFPVPALHIMDDHPPEAGRSLKWVHAWFFHGDRLERLEKRFGVIGRDSYAMTENGLCLYVPVDRQDLAKSGSVGVPMPWREIRIVDEHGSDVSVGEVGEAWTAGPGHMQGYYRKTAANRDSFRGRWFRTGDLMRLGNDGGYYLVGRMKDMIKRSGENISAAEVEDCLCKLPGIVMAAVLAVPDAARGEEVKAYVLLSPGQSKEKITPQVIFAHCANHIAKFKIPRYLTYVNEFPLTAGNDKVAKSRLAAAAADLTAGAHDRIEDKWR